MPPRRESDMERNIRRRKAKLGNPSPHGLPVLPNNKFEEYASKLDQRPLYITRFYHAPTMITLGAHETLQNMFQNIGWRGFLTKCAPTYAIFTLQFLQTYAYDFDQRVITFTQRDTRYHLTFDQVNEAFGVDTEMPLANRFHEKCMNFKEAAKNEFWQRLSNDPQGANFNNKSRDYHIVHPMWILAHRVLSASVTARSEVGQMNGHELFFMYCMYKKIPVDLCDFFLEKCDTIRSRRKGEIGIGGLVTLLGEFAGFDYTEEVDERLSIAEDSIYLTIRQLKNMYLIREAHDGGYDWLTGAGDDPKLKCPCFKISHDFMRRFKVLSRSTWKPAFHYSVRVKTTRVDYGASGSGRGDSDDSDDDDDEEDEEMGDASDSDEEGDDGTRGGGDGTGAGSSGAGHEEEEHPLSVYQQLAGLTIQTRRNTQEIRGNRQILEQMQYNQQLMMQQQHDMWSYFRPQGGYPSYPQYRPPTGDAYYPYPPPPGGYPPHYQHPDDAPQYRQPPPGGYPGYYQPPPGGPYE